MNNQVVVIDYGMGNLLSVTRAFQHFGVDSVITNDPEVIKNASRLVLPGVGAFPDAMRELKKRALIESICSFASKDKFLLGICLGMQLLMGESEEHGTTQGLNLIEGGVRLIPATGTDGQPHKIPHVGWNRLLLPPERSGWDNTIFEGVTPGESTYFVHSFTAAPEDPRCRLADASYNGCLISAAVKKGNIYGCQFHPEKSGEAGLKIIRNFLEMSAN